MQKEWTEDDLKEIARQLGKPEGELGLKTGQMMNKSNGAMIRRAFELLEIKSFEKVLEIGPGNGEHVEELLQNTSETRYWGVDISETMIVEANKINESLINQGKVSFVSSDGKMLPFEDHCFDKIFTVNTIYFWQEPGSYAFEIYRILKPGGTFCLALADRSFMEKLPFTQFGFQLYDKESAKKRMENTGFVIEKVVEELDITVGNMGQQVEREIIIVVCKKPAL